MNIRTLIPQRPPILMVDELLSHDKTHAVTSFMVKEDNRFMEEDGRIAEVALIEHMAQSASALAGQRALDDGCAHVPIGYIGEVRKCSLTERPKAGCKLITHVEWGLEVGEITFVNTETQMDDKVIARAEMKLFIDKQ